MLSGDDWRLVVLGGWEVGGWIGSGPTVGWAMLRSSSRRRLSPQLYTICGGILSSQTHKRCNPKETAYGGSSAKRAVFAESFVDVRQWEIREIHAAHAEL